MISRLQTAAVETKKRQEPSFELIAGNIALDFINTLDDRPSGDTTELLEEYRDLVRFGAESGVPIAKQADELSKRYSRMAGEAEHALRRARKLREALHEIFFASIHKKIAAQAAIDLLNVELQDAARHSRLMQRGRVWERRFDELESSFDAMLWPITEAAANLLVSSDLALVRACSSPTCRWFFLDTSKNHHRRWCSMKLCGNRTKVRRFYAKQKG